MIQLTMLAPCNLILNKSKSEHQALYCPSPIPHPPLPLCSPQTTYAWEGSAVSYR
jgi:hypothetical protein